MFLYPYKYDVVKSMHNECILNGGVGSGKSRPRSTISGARKAVIWACISNHVPISNL